MKELHQVWFFRIVFGLILGVVAVTAFIDPLKEERPIIVGRRY